MSRRKSELIKTNLWSSSEAVYNYGFLNAKSIVYVKKRIKHGKTKDIIARWRSGVRFRKYKVSIQVVEQKSVREKQNINSLVLHIYRKRDVNGCVNKIRQDKKRILLIPAE